MLIAKINTLNTAVEPANRISWLNRSMAKSTPTLKERLERIMREMGWDHGDLVRESGASSSAVSQWLGHSSKIIKSIGQVEAAERLSWRTGYSALWIAKGIGPEKSGLHDALRQSATLREAMLTIAKSTGELTPEQKASVIADLAKIQPPQ